jgi:hypothetical protein
MCHTKHPLPSLRAVEWHCLPRAHTFLGRTLLILLSLLFFGRREHVPGPFEFGINAAVLTLKLTQFNVDAFYADAFAHLCQFLFYLLLEYALSLARDLAP